MEKFWLLQKLEKSRVLSHIYVMFFVIISFVIFNGENLAQGISDLGGLFGIGGIELVSAEALYCLRSFGFVIIIAGIGATPLIGKVIRHIGKRPLGEKSMQVLELPFLLVLLLIMTAYLVDGSFNPFLYFRF